MYIPIFIAILMGLLAPINQSAHRANETVYVKFDGSVPPASTLDTDSIPPDGDEDGPGGDNGQLPPPKP